jgi:hypothetical protein
MKHGYALVWCIWFPYGSWGSHLEPAAPMWQHTPPIWIYLAATWYMAPIQRTPLPHGPIRCMWLPLPPIWCPLAPTWLQNGMHGSRTVHMAPLWSLHSACGSQMPISASNMVHMAPMQCTPMCHHLLHVAPVWHHLTPLWCLQLPFIECGSQTEHATPKWCHPPSKWHDLAPIELNLAHMAPIWPTHATKWPPYGTICLPYAVT